MVFLIYKKKIVFCFYMFDIDYEYDQWNDVPFSKKDFFSTLLNAFFFSNNKNNSKHSKQWKFLYIWLRMEWLYLYIFESYWSNLKSKKQTNIFIKNFSSLSSSDYRYIVIKFKYLLSICIFPLLNILIFNIFHTFSC